MENKQFQQWIHSLIMYQRDKQQIISFPVLRKEGDAQYVLAVFVLFQMPGNLPRRMKAPYKWITYDIETLNVRYTCMCSDTPFSALSGSISMRESYRDLGIETLAYQTIHNHLWHTLQRVMQGEEPDEEYQIYLHYVYEDCSEDVKRLYEDLSTDMNETDNPVWKTVHGLGYVTDETLETADTLLKEQMISEVKVLPHEIQIRIQADQAVCKENTYAELWKRIEIRDFNKEKETFYKYILKEYQDLDFCSNRTCGYEQCPFITAGYISYLKDQRLYDAYIREREEFRNTHNAEYTSPYGFTWEPDGGLRYLPENIFTYAEYFEKNVSEGFTLSLALHKDYEGTQNKGILIIQNLGDILLEEVSVRHFRRMIQTAKAGAQGSLQGYFLENYQGSLPQDNVLSSVLITAAYIHYLRTTGQEDRIITDREFYAEHRRMNDNGSSENAAFMMGMMKYVRNVSEANDQYYQIADELTEKGLVEVEVSENPDPVSKWRDQSGKCTVVYADRSYRDPVVDMPVIFAEEEPEPVKFTLSGMNQKSTFIIFAGVFSFIKKNGCMWMLRDEREQYIQKRDARYRQMEKEIPEFAEALSRQINSPKQTSLFAMLETEGGLNEDFIAEETARRLYNLGKIDDAKPLYSTLREFINHQNSYPDDYDPEDYPVQNSVKRKEFLYVLRGVDEYLERYRTDSKCREYLNNTLQTLNNMPVNIYILIITDKVSGDDFLKLDIRLEYLFGGCHKVVLKNMTSDQLYSKYYEGLTEKKRKAVDLDPDFFTSFVDWSFRGRKYLPLKNGNLASFLSGYTNEAGEDEPLLPVIPGEHKDISELLDQFVGLDYLKNTIYEVQEMISFFRTAESIYGMKMPALNMHMLFTGNPGTGKTMVASVIAKVLYNIGYLRKDSVMSVERKDLVANYMGQTAGKTNDVIKSALGGVLFIDEAYSLAVESSEGRDYGREVIEQLLTAMEKYKDDLVIIFAGYEKEMESFLNSNPGIASRIGYRFRFRDYDAESLRKIFIRKINTYGFEITEDGIKAFDDLVKLFMYRPNFGNGRFVDRVFENVLRKHAVRIEELEDQNEKIFRTITAADIPQVFDIAETMPENENYNGPSPVYFMQRKGMEDLLKDIVGMQDIKRQLEIFEAQVSFMKLAEERNMRLPAANLHMLFTGSSGTGKTMMARIAAQILYENGNLTDNKILEVEAKDLIGRYAGETAPKTDEVIKKALGGVLFIDEAYLLTQSTYGAEAVGTLITAMENHKNDLVVIFAGYEKEMLDFVHSNPGISSRIGQTFTFTDYSPEELLEIFKKKTDAVPFRLEEEAVARALSLFRYFYSLPDFGNGRFVDRVLQKTIENIAVRVKKDQSKAPDVIEAADIPAVEEMIECMTNKKVLVNPGDITEALRSRIAYHELGHALVQKQLFPADEIKLITIMAEGSGTLGYVQHETNEKRILSTSEDIENMIKVRLAGMAAEEIFCGVHSTGNSNDLHTASQLAMDYIGKYGMDKERLLTSLTDEETRKAANDLLVKLYDQTKSLLDDYRTVMPEIHAMLMEKGRITEEELMQSLEDR